MSERRIKGGTMVSPEASESVALEESLFHAARSLTDPAARAAFLDSACRDKPRLRARLDGLLLASEAAAYLFDPLATEGRGSLSATVGGRLGDYELIQEIGRGGMGQVYRARHVVTQEVVALKVVAAGASNGTDKVRRFENEARAAAGLQHPNIVRIREIGSSGAVHFFSMDLIEGETLAERMKKELKAVGSAAQPAGMGRPFVCVSFQPAQFCKIARAVEYAHQRGVLHRDLKPGNILIDGAGEPHLIDFGLAKVLLADLGLTRTADVMGTPSHMAPEQASGRECSVATDVYGLGAILYEAITGRPPFRAESPVETLRQVIEQAPLYPATLNPAVDATLALICLRCLEKDPRHRYSSVLALVEDLERWDRSDPILARPVGVVARAARWSTRNRLAASFIATLLLGLCVLAGLLLQVSREKNKQSALALELRSANQESTRLLARAVGMVRENLESLWSNGERNSMLVGSDEVAALANRPVSAVVGRAAPTRLTLGLMAEDSPTGRAQRYADLLAYLEERLTAGLGHPVRIDIRFYKFVYDCRADLCAGRIDLVRCGALPFLRSRQQFPGLQPIVVRMGEEKLGVLFTRAGSDIHSVADLKGRRVAFGETNSSVSFRAQMELAQHGIGAKDLAVYDFLDSSLEFSDEVRDVGFEEAIRRIGYLHSHAQVIEGVLSGRYDAGVAAFRAFQINHSRGLTAIPDSEFISSRPVWAARAGLDAKVVGCLREAMTALRSEPWLTLLPDHPDGYEKLSAGTFADEEAWLDRVAALFPVKPSPRVSPAPSPTGP